ncbi:MAG TPA: glycoside hydrolase family 38 C-terminal domain-containing protein, partial [Solirubrobacteraceae bacterium]|nr:glycoside hydrolase family 38 C-terminal domain-containing protein [Solirubrobacteraceae bacterium]
PGAEPVVVELEGFSARTVDLAAAKSTRPPTEGSAIESDLLRVEARPDGTLSIFDKPSGRRFEGLHRLEDEPDMGDLYNFCPVPDAPVRRSEGAAVRVLRDGPVIYELELRIAGPLSPTTVVRLIKGIRRVEFHTTIENRTRDHRLRAVFPTGALDPTETTVRAEGQFALVHRPLHPPEPRTEWVEPPDPTQHTLGAVALGPLALLTKGLPEYEARPTERGPELCLTLLRAVGLISRASGAISTRPLTAGPALPTPEGQCLGRHELEYALLPGADTLDATALLRASMDYRHPFVLAPAGTQLDAPLSIEGGAVFSCLKGAEDGDGLILRCFNPTDERVRVRIHGDFEMSRVRLDETDVAGQITELGPGQILTVRLR